ncbi:MAG: arginine deiminase-related protein [Gallionella sp.]
MRIRTGKTGEDQAMKRFLMCEPKFFEVRYVINPWMEGNLGKVNRELAHRQWKNLHDLVARLASVSLIEPVAGLPDMVFTANAGFVHRNEVIASSFLHSERKPETKFFEQFFFSRGYRVQHLRQETVFEGAGDALFDTQGRLWFGSGIRSEAKALDDIADMLDIEGCGVEVRGLELVDPLWYHLDMAFCPLPEGRAIAYEKAFARKSVAALDDAFANNIIWVSEADARNFACNAVAIDQTILMHRATAELKSALEQRGFEVLETDVSEFIKAGGACKCLTLEI